MLDFPEEFFEAEVREDFLIDKTMKTVWAAELEVLQVIAEICDRHGLTWYAAFGTMLGAVRHQGFVPWDDDMDIMMKRADFMKLMRVLPDELPEGFRARGAFAKEPYPEYHACITNGNQISIAKDWLERFHGCPFMVGIDIFPLDYLPRNEEERIIQTKLIMMARQVVWIAKDSEHTEEDVQELCEYLDALEKYCKIKIDRTPVEKQQWGDLVPPMWKLVHELAMLYNEEEADDMVMFVDYIKWPQKKYPKEWFDEVIAMPFEQFAVPVPAGYDGFLRKVYGDYNVRIRGAMHDYPFYQKQLEYLRDLLGKLEEAVEGGEKTQ